jgi:FAD/FMN-containing dehydrogenase
MQSHEYYPTSENEVLQILQDAKAKSLSVHPFSGGHNWGYGEDISLNPANYKINFSKMNKIIGFDTDFGLLRIQPGVTQKDLENFLIQNNLDYYVPNTGAGGRGSILGNALERGFGIAPIQDHASSIVSLKGFLADGSVYESTLKEIDSTLAECFQWGIGPQLDLLASQSSWIIITEVTIQLVKKFERTDILIASFADKQIGAVVETLRGLTQALPGNIVSIKILNRKLYLKTKCSACV